MGKKIALFNQKGGVGKTTTGVNYAAPCITWAKTLIVDTDPQGTVLPGWVWIKTTHPQMFMMFF